MRRIMAIILLAAVLALTLSVPALADPSEPPSAYGEFNSWLVQSCVKDLDIPYGKVYLAPIMWAIWYGNTPWDNGGEYIAYMKDVASY